MDRCFCGFGTHNVLIVIVRLRVGLQYKVPHKHNKLLHTTFVCVERILFTQQLHTTQNESRTGLNNGPCITSVAGGEDPGRDPHDNGHGHVRAFAWLRPRANCFDWTTCNSLETMFTISANEHMLQNVIFIDSNWLVNRS